MDSKQIFEILMRENASMLLTYIRSVAGTGSAVDDIFQETMITAWKRLDDFDRSRAFGPWLRGIAKNHALNHYRKSSRDMLMCNESIFEHLDAQFAHIDDQQDHSWKGKTNLLHECINALPSIYKQVIDLRYMNELKTAEVNKHIDINKETLKKRLQRAKAKLLQCLKEKGFLPSSGETLA